MCLMDIMKKAVYLTHLTLTVFDFDVSNHYVSAMCASNALAEGRK